MKVHQITKKMVSIKHENIITDYKLLHLELIRHSTYRSPRLVS